MKVLIKQLIIEQKLFYRNPVSVFWTYLFPVFIMLIIGWFFNDSYKRTQTKTIHIIDEAKSPLSKRIVSLIDKSFITKQVDTTKDKSLPFAKGNTLSKEQSIANYKNMDKIFVRIVQNKSLDKAVLKVYTNSNYDYRNYIDTLYSITYKLNNDFLSKSSSNPFASFKKKELLLSIEHLENKTFKYSDFLVPGIIAMSIMSTCIFGVGISLTSYREKGNLRRLALTPLRKWVFILANILHRYTIILIQSFLLLIIAYMVFSLKPKGDILSLLIILTVGLATFVSIGFIIASRASKVESANALSNIIFYPLLLLGSVYFSLDAIPLVLHPLVKITPLFHLTEALRKVINYGVPFYELSYHIAPLSIATIICLFISIKIFRWE